MLFAERRGWSYAGRRPPNRCQLRRDATKGLLAFLPTAASKVAAQHGKDHDGDKAAAKRLRRKRRAEAAGKKSADSSAGGAAGGSRQQRLQLHLPQLVQLVLARAHLAVLLGRT
uniref:Uncharacterized protein n=1 Tax=Tetradesmus obliquus TaxID=3088 RepID=A0A383VK16_TETOB